jgi:hypothetical protein
VLEQLSLEQKNQLVDWVCGPKDPTKSKLDFANRVVTLLHGGHFTTNEKV